MKLCMDCAYFIVNGSKCGYRQRPPDYVRGHPAQNVDAQIEREWDAGCGPEAKYFKIIPVASAA